MALVNICDVTVLNNPSSFLKPFQFEITFECHEDLSEGKKTTLQLKTKIIKWMD